MAEGKGGIGTGELDRPSYRMLNVPILRWNRKGVEEADELITADANNRQMKVKVKGRTSLARSGWQVVVGCRLP